MTFMQNQTETQKRDSMTKLDVVTEENEDKSVENLT